MSDRSAPRSPEYWLRLGTEDLACATAILDMKTTQPRHSVGLASQAAEKALKAAVASVGVEPPRSHDLVFLAHRSAAILRTTVQEHDLRRLSDAHEQARYPRSSEELFDAEEAVELTGVASVILAESLAALQSRAAVEPRDGPPTGMAQLIAQGQVTPALHPKPAALPTPIPPTTDIGATETLLAERAADAR